MPSEPSPQSDEFRPQDGPVLPRSVIVERRYQRRAARLKSQRDHWKAEYEKLRDFLASFPFYERQRVKMDEWKRERERVQDLERRCREQSLLIEKLDTSSEKLDAA